MTWSLYIKKVNETVYLYSYHGSSLISAINNCLEINEITVLTGRVVYTCLPMYHSNIECITMNLHMGLEMTDCIENVIKLISWQCIMNKCRFQCR